jgi:hypothetical protein
MKVRLAINRNTTARSLIEGLKDFRTTVGWFADTKYDNSTVVAKVASEQEFGTAIIPARPFMRPARNKNLNKWTNILKHNLQTTHNVSQSLDALAMVVEGDIRQSIVDVSEPPLSLVTIRNRMARYKTKQFQASITKPLIDTGLMISSVSHKTEAK